MRSIILAIQFLTIIPLRVKGDVTERDMARCAAFFPIVGALQGLILLVSARLLGATFPADISSAFIVAIAIITSGGFHLDGLADTFDALAVKSSGDATLDREKRLAVMKDSSTGAIGVVAVVTVLLLKLVLIRNELASPVPLTSLLVLFLMPVFSKWIMVPAIYHGTSARKDGLGRILIDDSSPSQIALATSIAILLFCVVFCAPVAQYNKLHGILFFILLPAGYIFALMAEAFCSARFGGLTGDNLGALSELSEILYLAGSFLWLQHSI